MKRFVVVWFSFMWFFVGLMEFLSDPRPFQMHLVRGLLGGLAVAALTVLFERTWRSTSSGASQPPTRIDK